MCECCLPIQRYLLTRLYICLLWIPIDICSITCVHTSDRELFGTLCPRSCEPYTQKLTEVAWSRTHRAALIHEQWDCLLAEFDLPKAMGAAFIQVQYIITTLLYPTSIVCLSFATDIENLNVKIAQHLHIDQMPKSNPKISLRQSLARGALYARPWLEKKTDHC